MRFIKWRVRCTKANPGKQDSEKESMGPSILIQKPGLKKKKRERKKLWTKGKKRHKRRWIIQYAPLVDSFVILYNGPLEKNQVIAWKRSLFLSHHALMLEKNDRFLAKMSNVHVDEPQTVQSQNDHNNNFYYRYNDNKKIAHNWCTRLHF